LQEEKVRNLQREILLGFWKVHILYHAGKEPVVGQWILQELRRHGYEVSPGTLYPMLARLEKFGWLAGITASGPGPGSRKEYTLTPTGQEVLDFLRGQVAEMYREIVLGEEDGAEHNS
jgi:PadR family transcriptional regulator, regulatory protein PadR